MKVETPRMIELMVNFFETYDSRFAELAPVYYAVISAIMLGITGFGYVKWSFRVPPL